VESDDLVAYLKRRERDLAWSQLEAEVREDAEITIPRSSLPGWWGNFIAMLAITAFGAGTGVIALIFNYILFVILLHMDFNFDY
jgi:hypothetical protein